MSFNFPEGGMEIAMLLELGLLIKFTMIAQWPNFMYTAFDQIGSNLDHPWCEVRIHLTQHVTQSYNFSDDISTEIFSILCKSEKIFFPINTQIQTIGLNDSLIQWGETSDISKVPHSQL